MIVFLKVKKITFYWTVLYGFKKMKDYLFIIRCAIKFDMKLINIVFVFFSLKSGLKSVLIFFIWFWIWFWACLWYYFNFRLQSEIEKFHSGIYLLCIKGNNGDATRPSLGYIACRSECASQRQLIQING
jgi:hypothetical protein